MMSTEGSPESLLGEALKSDRRCRYVEDRIAHHPPKAKQLAYLRWISAGICAATVLGLVYLNNGATIIQLKSLVTVHRSANKLIVFHTQDIIMQQTLLSGIYKNVVPEDSASRYGVAKFSAYVLKDTRNLLVEANEGLRSIIRLGENTPAPVLRLSMVKSYNEFSVVPDLRMDFNSENSFKINSYSELVSLPKDYFLLVWPLLAIRLDYLKYFMSFEEEAAKDRRSLEAIYRVVDGFDQ